ncbi:MAG: hypothetical protein A3G73_03390 [Rhodospirillales bacterium RIFCSPLOWO2_12_FULL_67_15]|nr:MAG: hypothetical protein A3G73_03390 [Rhodospirillales bacterium RIFCSPLOWO2_12_FULL_67_15]
MSGRDRLPDKSSDKSVAEFLERAKAVPAPATRGEPQGRLLFAMDATASREPAWDKAARIQGEMFRAAEAVGGLSVQLAFYRGFDEFKVSRWTGDAAEMTRLMSSVFCLAGETQIRKTLRHAVNETKTARVNALVFVGDACEEDVDRVGEAAGELGLLGVPAFMFHEGENAAAEFAFRQIAKLTRGAYVRFDAGSAAALRDLLAAVAVYAAGGAGALAALARAKGGETLAIARQVAGEKD